MGEGSGVFEVEARGKHLHVRMHRPEARNALGFAGDVAAVRALADRVNHDPQVRCVVLTGAGSAFSAGAPLTDLREKTGTFAGDGPALAHAIAAGVQEIVRVIWSIEAPIIAAINGPAIGLGLHVACACDLRIAAEGASFGVPFLRLGIVPGDSGAWLLTRMLGPTRAAQLMFTSKTVDAATIGSWGFLNEVVPAEALEARAEALADELDTQPPLQLRLAKRLYRESLTASFETLQTLSATMQALTHVSEDHKEAMAAHAAKRAPSFEGR